MELGVEEGRVLGCLVEKQLTTPQQYPLSLSALLGVCNQTSNRDPVVAYDVTVVEAALGALKDRGLVRFVLPSHGRSVVRYRHVLDESLGLDPVRLALLAALLLRGPQTAGELRSRTERMVDLADTAAVEHELSAMTTAEGALVLRLDRRPGQKEERWAEQLTAGGGGGPDADPRPETDPARPSGVAPVGPLDQLRAQMAEIRSDVEELRAAVEALRSALGG